MAKIIKEREYKTHKEVELCFYRKDNGEVCYGFPMISGKVVPCKQGTEPNTYELCSKEECSWWQNYINASNDESLYSGVEIHKWGYHEPAVAICECGKSITLDYDAEECPYCGRLHNLWEQELLPRELWEEDYEEEYC